MPRPLTPEDPREVGGYELVGRLGEGGMGVVYLGRTERGAPVAIKTIRTVHAHDDEFRARFRRELDATLRVGGGYVAQVIDADLDAAPPFFVTEFIPGDTLEQRIVRQGPLHGDKLVAVAVGIATGLAELHEAGVAHRDITPRNVVLSPEGPKIIDLGVAHMLGATRMTRTGLSMGTPAWMAPEHARGDDVGQPADIFAWASLVLYAATGEPPFGEGRAEAVLYRIVHDAPDTSALAPPLRGLVEEALGKEPADRPAALDVASELAGTEPHLVATAAGTATMLQRTPLAQTAPTAGASCPAGTRALPADAKETELVPTADGGERRRSRPRVVVVAGAIATAGLVLVGIFAWNLLSSVEIADGSDPPATEAEPTTTPPEAMPTQTSDESEEGGEDDAFTPNAEPVDDEVGTPQVPRPRLPDAPWAGPAVAPQALGERHAAEWWAEFMSDDGCSLYLPIGMEADNDLVLDGPTATRFNDVHFTWWRRDDQMWGLTIVVLPPHAANLDRYFDGSGPDITYSDGSELRTGADDVEAMERLLAIPGEDCFYEITAYDMVSLAWGIEGLRLVEFP